MNRIHPRITCDVCNWNNIAGIRYACLVCEEYDMCEMCFQHRCSSKQHKPYHPMQPIFPEEEFFDSLRGVGPDDLRIFCCPYCSEKDLNVTDMFEHCQRYHRYGGHPVRCPICLVYKARNRNLLKTPLLQHMLSRHKDPVQQSQDCSICMEPMTAKFNIRNLQCGHPFHSICISNWLQNRDNCPLCRAPVNRHGNFIDVEEYLPM